MKCVISQDSCVLSKIYKGGNFFSIKFSFQSLYFYNFCTNPLFFISKSTPRNMNLWEFVFLGILNGKKNLWRNFFPCKFFIGEIVCFFGMAPRNQFIYDMLRLLYYSPEKLIFCSVLQSGQQSHHFICKLWHKQLKLVRDRLHYFMFFH